MILPVLERAKINYKLPTLTLDVNQIALKDPSTWPNKMDGLAQFEWNYFEERMVELCVTPETPEEITQGIPTCDLGAVAYNRFQKSQLFKSRPPGTTLSLTDQQANTLWMGVRQILWPGVNDAHLIAKQRADVNQIFFHSTASGSLANSAFLTIDHNFHDHAEELNSELGIRILYPDEAWEEFQSEYGLYIPNSQEIKLLRDKQELYFQQLRIDANKQSYES